MKDLVFKLIRSYVSLFLMLILVILPFKAFASIENEITVQLSQVELQSKLKKEYSGYQYIIENKHAAPVMLLNGQVINAVNGNIAAQAVTDGSPIGITWAIAGPVGLFTLGIGWIVGLLATPIVWAVSSSKSKKARRESTAYPNIVNTGILNTGDIITTKILVPIGTQPQLRLTFQNPKTKEVFSVNK
ncbi:MAG: hypothetical protein ACKO34_08845 [Vampirovibrionales bacterium]